MEKMELNLSKKFGVAELELQGSVDVNGERRYLWLVNVGGSAVDYVLTDKALTKQAFSRYISYVNS